jgi:hypothetical protein
MPGGSLPAATGSRFDRSWRSGDKIHLNGNDYQPHGGVIQAMAPDRSRVSRRVDARQLGDRSAVVALRQVGVLCETESALRRKMAMAREAGLLTEMRGMRGMPRLVARGHTGTGECSRQIAARGVPGPATQSCQDDQVPDSAT